MQTLLELLNKSTAFLDGKGVEKARLNAELLFAEIFKCKRLDLYLMFERPVSGEEADALRGLIVKRGKREPLQYVLGQQDFYNISLKCDSRALIPRQETEELVARIAERFRKEHPADILDLGTGTGAIALSLAKAFPEAKVTAVDASEEALSLARENAVSNQLDDQVSFLQSNWFSGLNGHSYDLIVSNPPYLTEAEWECAQPEVKTHEPKAALVGQGEDGADDLRMIIRDGCTHLNEDGLLALETGIAQHSTLELTARHQDYMSIQCELDDSRRPRYFFARK